MRIIAVANQKGGCGKTITSVNLASSLAFLGKKVLLVDLDPQGHATLGLGVKAEELDRSLYDIFDITQENKLTIYDVLIKRSKNLDLVPSQIILSAIEQQLAGVYGRERKLLEALEPVSDDYDFVIIDSPPNLGLLTFNALRAANEVIIPIEASLFSLNGIEKLMETLRVLKETLRHEVRAYSLITIFDSRTKFCREIYGKVRTIFGEETFKTIIHQTVRLKEAANAGVPIAEFDKNSMGFKDHLNLAREVIEKGFEVGAGKLSDITEKFENKQSEKENVKEELVTVGKSEAKEKEEKKDVSPKGLISDVKEKNNVITVKSESSVKKKDPASGSTAEVVDIGIDVDKRGLAVSPKRLDNGVRFCIKAPEASQVQIAGDFNNWVLEDMSNIDEKGTWLTVFPLGKGRYRYKFIVDGAWMIDPSNPSFEVNPYGGKDSVIDIDE